MADCPFNPASESIADFIYRYGSQQQIVGNPEDIPCIDYVIPDYSIIYTPLDTVLPISLRRYSYYSVPGLFSLLDSSSMEVSGITSTFASPALGNRGRGVLIGFIDTGIDYTNPLFQNPDGTTRACLKTGTYSLPGFPTAIPAAGRPTGLNIRGNRLMQPWPPTPRWPWSPPPIPMGTGPFWQALQRAVHCLHRILPEPRRKASWWWLN